MAECWACTGCNYAISGSPGECNWLGGANTNQVHRFFLPPPPLPRNLTAGWNYLGCFNEGQPLLLPDRIAGVHTVTTCQAAAQTGGYNTAALRNAGECYACTDCNYGGFGTAASCPSNGGPSTNQVYILITAPPPMPPAFQVVVPLTNLISNVTCVAGNPTYPMTQFYGSSCGDIIKTGPTWNPMPNGYGNVRPKYCMACVAALTLTHLVRSSSFPWREDVAVAGYSSVSAARIHHQLQLYKRRRQDARPQGHSVPLRRQRAVIQRPSDVREADFRLRQRHASCGVHIRGVCDREQLQRMADLSGTSSLRYGFSSFPASSDACAITFTALTEQSSGVWLFRWHATASEPAAAKPSASQPASTAAIAT